MRDPLILDADVTVLLQAEVRRTGKSLQVLINEHLRFALCSGRGDSPTQFKIENSHLVARTGLNLDCIGDLLEIAEGPLHR